MIETFTLDLVEWIRTIPVGWVYLVFFAVAYLENVIPPVPGDVLVAFGGYLAAERLVSATGILGLTTIASSAGFMTMYAIGARWGSGIRKHRETHWTFRWINITYFDRAQRWMDKWGGGVVLANRFLAGTRSVIALMAGMGHLPVWRTLFQVLVSALLWNALLLAAGWWVRENWQQIGELINAYSTTVLILLVLVSAARWWYKRRRR